MQVAVELRICDEVDAPGRIEALRRTGHQIRFGRAKSCCRVLVVAVVRPAESWAVVERHSGWWSGRSPYHLSADVRTLNDENERDGEEVIHFFFFFSKLLYLGVDFILFSIADQMFELNS